MSNLASSIPDDVRAGLDAKADKLSKDPKALIADISTNAVRMLEQLKYLAFNPLNTRSGPQVQRGAIRDYIALGKEIIEIAKAAGTISEDPS